MQTQTQTQTIQANPANILDQFSEMLKTHSIIVPDRANLLRLFENIVDLCTQMTKTKLKAAIKAATPKPVPEAKKKPAAKKPVAATEELVGPADAGDCPVLSDLSKAPRGRGRPRKESSSSPVQSESSVNDAEKKKRGRPKKDKTVVVSSNEDEDALIAKMISDMKTLQSTNTTPVAIADPDEEVEQSEQSEQSMSPVYTAVQSQLAPVVVEADVVEEKKPNAKSKSKSAKEPKPAKEAKPKPAKEAKPKPAKEAKPKTNDTPVTSQGAPAESATPEPTSAAPTSASVRAPTISVPPRENKAQSDGKFYLMSGFPRVSFTYNGATYLRTETDNVYDPLTLELVGVWDHLNHEIIVAFDEEEGDIWMSDEE
jgi:hypothetical protein